MQLGGVAVLMRGAGLLLARLPFQRQPSGCNEPAPESCLQMPAAALAAAAGMPVAVMLNRWGLELCRSSDS